MFSGHDTQTVDSLCRLERGRVINQQEIEQNPGPYPVFSSQTLRSGQWGAIANYDFDGEYITWTTDGVNAGTVFYRTGKFNCTNICGVLSRKDSFVDMRFLAYQLKYLAKRHVNYIGIPKLALKDMAEIRVVLPDNHSDQVRIVNILDCLDSLIQQTKIIVLKMENIKTGLMQDLMANKVEKIKSLRTIGSSHKPFKNANPCRYNLYSAFDLINIYIGGTPKTDNPDCWDGSIDWLTVDDLRCQTRYVNEAFNKITNFGVHTSSTQILKKGMLIISARGTVGLISQLDKDMAFNQSCFGLDSNNPDKVTNDYLYYALSYALKGKVQYEFSNIYETITRETLRQLMIAVPETIMEQDRIVRIISSHEKQIEAEKKYLIKLYNIRNSLMQDLFLYEN